MSTACDINDTPRGISSSSPLATGTASYWCLQQCAPYCWVILLSDKYRQKKRSTLTCDTFCANRRGAALRVSDFEVDVLRDYRFETVVISFICHFHCRLSSGSDYWKQYEAQSWQRALGLARVMGFQLKGKYLFIFLYIQHTGTYGSYIWCSSAVRNILHKQITRCNSLHLLSDNLPLESFPSLSTVWLARPSSFLRVLFSLSSPHPPSQII